MKWILTLLSFFLCLAASAQESRHEGLKDLFKPQEPTTYSGYIKNSSNELEFTAALLFVGYKAVFSSQDMQSCVFYPSCSVYAIECLGHEPFPVSVFKIFDRLTRCHPLASPLHYQIHKSGQLYDPVKE